MLKCEHCIHKNVCIDGANYRNAERCRNFINENDVAPVKHGEWKQNRNIFECSECGYKFEHGGYLPFFNYCPCCGAKMDGDTN